MMHVRGYNENCGVFSTMGDTILCILSTVGDIISAVGVFSTVGYSNNNRFRLKDAAVHSLIII